MALSKKHNFDFSAGVPLAVGDRYYSQDLLRDWYYLLDQIGLLLYDMTGITGKCIMGGWTINTAGANNDCINLVAGSGYVPWSVTVPTTPWAMPPSTASEAMSWIRVFTSLISNFSLITAGADGGGVTVNHLKIAFAWATADTRLRAKLTGTYAYAQNPSYVLTCNSTPATSNEIDIGEIVWNSTTHAITITYPNRTANGTTGTGKIVVDTNPTITSPTLNTPLITIKTITNGTNYPITNTDGYSIIKSNYSSASSCTMPQASANTGRRIKTVNINTGVFTLNPYSGDALVGMNSGLNAAGVVTIPVQYSSIDWFCDGTNWIAESSYMKYGRQNMSSYIGGQTYNSVPLTLTGQTGFSLTRSIFTPWQEWDGTWKLYGNMVAFQTAGGLGSFDINGVTFKNVLNWYQIIFVAILNGTAPYTVNVATVNVNTGHLSISFNNNVTEYGVWFEAELDSKPTWVA